MKYLITFGTSNYSNALNSLSKSALQYFDNVLCYSPADVEKSFYDKNKTILDQSRGAGYWLWKPYLIHKTLNQINDGDTVFYVDAGNIFVSNPEPLFTKLVSSSIILFDNRDGMPGYKPAQNFISCKRDAFVLMDCDESRYINGLHLNASYQLYKKCEESLKFVNDYLNWCQVEEIITDTPNRHGTNYEGYYDHRHDQSVLSLLAIKHNITPLVDPSEWGNGVTNRLYDQLFYHHRNPNFVL